MGAHVNRAAAVCIVAGVLSIAQAATVSLGHPRYHASGRGEITTLGSIVEGQRLLTVANSASWSAGHGIRVRRAGNDVLLHNADSGWRLPPGAAAGSAATHDPIDKVEGAASARCQYSAMSPGPIDICEIDLGEARDFAFDELGLWLKSSRATKAGDLRIRILKANDSNCHAPIINNRCATFSLDLPAVAANAWREIFVELKRTRGNGLLDNLSFDHRFVVLECVKNCSNIDVRLDELRLVNDLVGTVETIKGGGKVFELNRVACRTVTGETVYHDDTIAVRTWLQEADSPSATRLFAPAGIYYINGIDLFGVGGHSGSLSLPLYNNAHLQCASPKSTIFKNTGRSATGPAIMFRAAALAPANVTIENCSFDWNGWNLRDFLTLVLITPDTESNAIAKNIIVRGNRFFDSKFPGIQGCDLGQDDCRTRQRHHVHVARVDGLWIERNLMSGGGRIQAGGSSLGRNMHINNNTLDFVNDNAITIVERGPGITEDVEIAGNIITNPVTTGIFFGADGEEAARTEGMILRNIAIRRNRISGFFVTAGIIGQLPRSATDIDITDNYIRNIRATDLGPGHFVSGLLLALQSADANPATRLRVERNTVLASGIHSTLTLGGIFLTTEARFSDLTISDNEVHCQGCPIDSNQDALAAGISIWRGDFEHVSVQRNRVVRANIALQLGGAATITDATIKGNVFLNSRSALSGQITIATFAGETVQAEITGNRLADGAGYGILCDLGGTLSLKNILNNTFIRNAAGKISGCVQ